MKFIKVLFLCLFGFYISAQNYFAKKISFDEGSNTGRSIIEHNHRTFILVSHLCNGLGCSSIAELSSIGDTIWVTRVPDIDVARASLIIKGDTITITGNNAPFNTKFRMAHYDFNGQKLGQTIEIEHPIEKFNSMFQLTSVRFQNKTLLTGTGMQNSIEYGLIYIMNADDELDTLLMLEPQENRSVMWEVTVDNDGNLYTYHDIDEGGSGEKYKKINKLDEDLDIIWSYKSEDSFFWDSGSNGDVLDDGRVLLVVYTPFTNSPYSSLRAINEDKSIDWQYNPPFSNNTLESISNVKQLSSGDILGMGRYTDVSLDEPIRDSPFFYKINVDGNVIWKRVFYEIDQQTGKSRTGFVRDAVELDNGDIYGTGVMKYDGHNEVFIFKVDSDGCLDTEDCEFVQLITDTEDVVVDQYELNVHPNPTSDVIQYSISENMNIRSVSMFDLNGQLLIRDAFQMEKYQVDISEFDNGVYLIKFLMDDGLIVYRKVVKQ
jgi:hypothetical protein